MNNELEKFKVVARFMAQQMQNCEFVIHDLNDLEHSIAYIGNGHISGRQIGDSATDLVLRVLKDRDYLNKDFTSVYRSVSAKGTVFNSSTFFIKDGNALIGLLCINEDLTQYQMLHDSVGKILSLAKPVKESQNVQERLVPTVDSLPTSVIDTLVHKQIQNVAHLSKDERMEIVRELDKKGIFLLKGSITEVAKTLKVSEATMYRYLQHL